MSLGDIILLIASTPIVLNMKFSMVGELSSYNAIMGQAWLHKIKTICRLITK